jgi:Tannase-like family of unknown function (DUF6351)
MDRFFSNWLTRSLAACALVASTFVAAAPGAPSSPSAVSHDFNIVTLSTRPDTVTGGDVLVRIDVPRTVPMAKVTITLNGNDITSTFRKDELARTLSALVTGLQLGANELSAWSNGNGKGRPDETLTLTNYPITGPVFSGPHETPFYCETTGFTFPDGTKPLGAPLDANCSIATRVDYFYRTTGGAWKPLAAPYTHPADLATTTTNEAKTVPFIIRLETGTVNRAIYQTSMLHDPASEPTPGLWRQSSAWNGRLVFSFGGGCTNGWYRQGASTGGVTDPVILGMGYAMASSSLNVFGNNCNDLLTSESLMVTKERFIETYGPPRYTLGFGCSGGSYQQHQAADAYPGLLDGIIPGCSFPEVGFATIQAITDARLLVHYYDDTAPGSLTQEQQRKIAGFLNYATLRTNTVYVGALRMAVSPLTPYCTIIPPAQRFDPVTNPTGVRCSVYDHTVNVYGRDPATGFALRPLDNVGIQYGLKALQAGVITMDQFLDLNEKIGGYDVNGYFQSARSVGDLPAIRAAYKSGRLTNGGLGLRDVPIIDYRAYTDDNPIGDIHLRYHGFSMRERLKKANGDADNQVMVVEDFRYGYYSSASPLLQFALTKMDQWVANIKADGADDSQHAKVVRNKPADLLEGCNTRAASPVFIAEKQTRDPSLQCEQLYPSAPAPREVAGASVASDVIKCQLKPADLNDYPVPITPAQLSKLQQIFPYGVCDWSKPGVGQDTKPEAWLFY